MPRKKAVQAAQTPSPVDYSLLFDALGQGLLCISREGYICSANQAAADWLGCPRSDLPGRAITDPAWQMFHEDGRLVEPQAHPLLAAIQNGQSAACIVMGLLSPGQVKPRWLKASVLPEPAPGGQAPQQVWINLLDITDQNRTSHLLDERVKELQAFYALSKLSEEEVPLATIYQRTVELLPQSWQYPEITWARILIQEQEYKSANFQPTPWKQTAAIVVPGAEAGRIEIGYTAEVPLEDEGPFLKEERLLLNSVAEHIGHITARKRSEEALQRKTRSLFMLSNCNQAVVRLADENVLLKAMCRICVEDGGYLMAWVGFAEDNPQKSVHPAAQYGFEEGYLETANITWADSERGRGPTGISIRTGQPSIAQNLLKDPNMAPWRNAAIRRGYQSSIALPLNIGGKTIGVFSLYAREPDAFNPEEVTLLVELANDMAYAIGALRMRAAQRELEEINQAILNATQESVYLIDAEGKMLLVNSECANRYNTTIQNLIGKNILSVQKPRYVKQRWSMIEAVIKERRPLTFEIEDTGRYFSVYLYPMLDIQGQVNRVAIYVRNITELKAVQNELEDLNRALEKRVEERTADLQRNEAMYRALFENSNDAIFLFTPDKENVRANPKGLEMIGYSLAEYQELFKQDSSALAAPEQHAEAENHLAAVLRGEDALPLYERTFVAKDGRRIDVEINLSSIRDADGRVLLVQNVARDITERKKAELALRESEASLRASRDELSIVNAALEKASRLKDEFLASMSHELRTPLTGILGLSEALLLETYGALNERQAKAVRMVETSGRHLLDLINDILDLSKIEAGKLDMLFELTPVSDICQSSLQLVKGMAHQKKQNMAFQMSPPAISMRADRRRLKQMLVNLLSNAIKFTPEGGKIGLQVEANQEDRMVCFTVWDKGIGIKQEDMGKLFRPFIQLDSRLSRQYSGTGLGLSLVQRMSELHGGSVQVESSPGEGSRFTIRLPWEENALPTSAVLFESLSGPVKNTLIIEDNILDAEQATRYLKDIGMQTVIVFQQVQGAVERAAQVKPGVILLDLNLADGYGLDLLTQLKYDERTRPIPVIITSVEERRSEAARLGAAGYLVKPYRKEDLRAVLTQLTATFQPAKPVLVIASQPLAPLVVITDDNEMLLDTMSDFLIGKGYRVITTRSGSELLERAPQLQPDLILMDIQMPGMDGLETTRRLRMHSNRQLAATPVIAVTALAMTGDREKCIQAGVDDYMSKPVVLQQLAKRIGELIEQKQNSATSPG